MSEKGKSESTNKYRAFRSFVGQGMNLSWKAPRDGRVKRPLGAQIASSRDARRPSFPLDLYFLSYAGYPDTKRRFLRAPSHAVQGLPFIPLPPFPPLLHRTPSQPFSSHPLHPAHSLSRSPILSQALVVLSRLLSPCSLVYSFRLCDHVHGHVTGVRKLRAATVGDTFAARSGVIVNDHRMEDSLVKGRLNSSQIRRIYV